MKWMSASGRTIAHVFDFAAETVGFPIWIGYTAQLVDSKIFRTLFVRLDQGHVIGSESRVIGTNVFSGVLHKDRGPWKEIYGFPIEHANVSFIAIHDFSFRPTITYDETRSILLLSDLGVVSPLDFLNNSAMVIITITLPDK